MKLKKKKKKKWPALCQRNHAPSERFNDAVQVVMLRV